MSRSKSSLPAALAAGFLSSGLFLAAASLGLGFFFLFISTLPLFFPALRSELRVCLIGGLIGIIPISILAGFDAGLMYWLYLALPAWYLARQSLLYAVDGKETLWFPIGLPLLQITIMGITTIAMMTGYYASVDGGIMGIISTQIESGFKDMEPEMVVMLKNVAEHWSFLVFGLTVWVWVLLLYAHLWVANRMLNDKKIRPSIALEPFTMPGWVIGLMAIAALASLIGSPSMQFLGKSALICMMLPYFLLGCALMHEASKNWPSRRFFLFFVYFMIVAQFWPALVLSGWGFFSHIKSLSGGAPSARS
ncbi:MAG: hypothetical protein LW823_05600 [Rickettsiales bacterium]|nr:hypothetical protein [Rickettsiales bacterium]